MASTFSSTAPPARLAGIARAHSFARPVAIISAAMRTAKKPPGSMADRTVNRDRNRTRTFAMDKKPGIAESWRDLAVYFAVVIIVALFFYGLLWAADELIGFTDWLARIL